MYNKVKHCTIVYSNEEIQISVIKVILSMKLVLNFAATNEFENYESLIVSNKIKK
jgi:hypothetical protein